MPGLPDRRTQLASAIGRIAVPLTRRAVTGGLTGQEPRGGSLAANSAWLTTSLTAATLLAWLQLLALDGDLAKAEPKTLRYRILHTAARLTRGQRRRHLAIPATWPWARAITTARTRICALPHAP